MNWREEIETRKRRLPPALWDAMVASDQGNAVYWYGRAGKPVSREPLDAEWVSIVRELLG